MRDHALLVPSFWLRGSGQRLRGNPPAQELAKYLFGGQNSTMIGLYHLGLPAAADDLGWPLSLVGAALGDVIEAGIAAYDPEARLLFLPRGAFYQIGPKLNAVGRNGKPDNRIAGIERMLAAFLWHDFGQRFLTLYRVPYNLTLPSDPSVPPARPFVRPAVGVTVLIEHGHAAQTRCLEAPSETLQRPIEAVSEPAKVAPPPEAATEPLIEHLCQPKGASESLGSQDQVRSGSGQGQGGSGGAASPPSAGALGPTSGDSSPRKRHRGARAGTRIPDGWVPKPGIYDWSLRTPDVQLEADVIDQQAGAFGDYWKSETSRTAWKADWDAAFHTWLRRHRRDNPSLPVAVKRERPQRSPVDPDYYKPRSFGSTMTPAEEIERMRARIESGEMFADVGAGPIMPLSKPIPKPPLPPADEAAP